PVVQSEADLPFERSYPVAQPFFLARDQRVEWIDHNGFHTDQRGVLRVAHQIIEDGNQKTLGLARARPTRNEYRAIDRRISQQTPSLDLMGEGAATSREAVAVLSRVVGAIQRGDRGGMAQRALKRSEGLVRARVVRSRLDDRFRQ